MFVLFFVLSIMKMERYVFVNYSVIGPFLGLFTYKEITHGIKFIMPCIVHTRQEAGQKLTSGDYGFVVDHWPALSGHCAQGLRSNKLAIRSMWTIYHARGMLWYRLSKPTPRHMAASLDVAEPYDQEGGRYNPDNQTTSCLGSSGIGWFDVDLLSRVLSRCLIVLPGKRVIVT